jgi:hypothetical protein
MDEWHGMNGTTPFIKTDLGISLCKKRLIGSPRKRWSAVANAPVWLVVVRQATKIRGIKMFCFDSVKQCFPTRAPQNIVRGSREIKEKTLMS